MGNTPNGNPGGRAATRAVALVGPAGTGKTSLAEALLFAGGTTTRQGSVEAGSSLGDSSPEARARGSSTELNLYHCTYLGDRLALLDLPGAAGFCTDGLAALRSVDMAVVVIDPAPDRAALAEPALRQLDQLGLPHAIFINKIEQARAGAVHELIAQLQPASREPLALRQIPLRSRDGHGNEQVTGYVDLALERAYRYRPGHASEQVEIPAELRAREQAERNHLLETLADFDDALLEALLLDETPDPALVLADLAADTAGNKLVPVLLGSALSGGGVHRLLKLLRHEAPQPQRAAARLGITGSALHVFKIAHGGAMGRLALGRVLGGTLREGDELASADGPQRAGALFAIQGDKTAKQSSAGEGEVVAVARLDAARCGAILGACTAPERGQPDYPPRNAALAITTRDRRDDVKLSTALHRLCEEDPALEWQQDSHQTILRGINDEHLALVLARLQRRYGVAVESRTPQVAYRESIRQAANARGRHKKQSGGHGQYGDCVIAIRPLERGAGFQFEDRITGGAVPRQYIPAIEAGIREAMERGPLGFPVVDVAVTLLDGSFHTVDSSELAFRIAGRMAMAEALAAAAPFLLEPIVRLTAELPAGTGSRAGSVVSARRGQILGLSPHGEWARWEQVEALLPESALSGLDAELRSLSQGLAQFAAGFDHLAELSGKPADEVIRARAAEPH